MEAIKNLHKTLRQRKRPEDVAQMIFEILESKLSSTEKNILEKATKGSLKKALFGYTSMMQEFAAVVGAEKQVKKTIEIFKLEGKELIDYDDIEDIEKFIREVSLLLNKTVGANNFVTDRLKKPYVFSNVMH